MSYGARFSRPTAGSPRVAVAAASAMRAAGELGSSERQLHASASSASPSSSARAPPSPPLPTARPPLLRCAWWHASAADVVARERGGGRVERKCDVAVIAVARAHGELAEHVECAGRGRRLGLDRRGAVARRRSAHDRGRERRDSALRERHQHRRVVRRELDESGASVASPPPSPLVAAAAPPSTGTRRPTITQRALGDERQPRGRSRDDHSADGHRAWTSVDIQGVISRRSRSPGTGSRTRWGAPRERQLASCPRWRSPRAWRHARPPEVGAHPGQRDPRCSPRWGHLGAIVEKTEPIQAESLTQQAKISPKSNCKKTKNC